MASFRSFTHLSPTDLQKFSGRLLLTSLRYLTYLLLTFWKEIVPCWKQFLNPPFWHMHTLYRILHFDICRHFIESNILFVTCQTVIGMARLACDWEGSKNDYFQYFPFGEIPLLFCRRPYLHHPHQSLGGENPLCKNKSHVYIVHNLYHIYITISMFQSKLEYLICRSTPCTSVTKLPLKERKTYHTKKRIGNEMELETKWTRLLASVPASPFWRWHTA